MASVLLASWPLRATTFDDEVASGPVPLLFAEDIDTATESLSSNIAKSHADCMKVNKAFLAKEHITLKEAADMFKRPR